MNDSAKAFCTGFTRADEASIAETTPATSLAPFAAVVPRLPIVAGAQTTADKPSCVGDTRTEGNCVSVNPDWRYKLWISRHTALLRAGRHGRLPLVTVSLVPRTFPLKVR